MDEQKAAGLERGKGAGPTAFCLPHSYSPIKISLKQTGMPAIQVNNRTAPVWNIDVPMWNGSLKPGSLDQPKMHKKNKIMR